MEQYDICVLSTLPMTLYIEPDNYGEVSQKTRFGLNSLKEYEVRETTRGLLDG